MSQITRDEVEGSAAFISRETIPRDSRVQENRRKILQAVNLAPKVSDETRAGLPINSSGVTQLICFELRMPLVKRADKINETAAGGV